MDNIQNAVKRFSAQDLANVITKVEELAKVNAELEYLLARGSNDEKLVDRKRELQSLIREYKPIISNKEETSLKELEIDEELVSLKSDFDSLVSRYKQRKIELEAIIRRYTDGNAD
jgi:hypothetical protein